MRIRERPIGVQAAPEWVVNPLFSLMEPVGGLGRRGGRAVGVGDGVWAHAAPLAERRGLVVVEVQVAAGRRTPVVRVVVHKAGGVTLADIEGFHRELAALLDADDRFSAADFALEVSSPGAERPLRTARDFQIFAGRGVRLAARAPVNGRREWSGRLAGLEAGTVVVTLAGGESLRLPLESIAWARLADL